MISWDWSRTRFVSSTSLNCTPADELSVRLNELIIQKVGLYQKMIKFSQLRQKHLLKEKFLCFVKNSLRRINVHEEREISVQLINQTEDFFISKKKRIESFLKRKKLSAEIFMEYGIKFLKKIPIVIEDKSG